MGAVGDILLALAAVALVIALSLEYAFGVLIAVWLLVPSNLSLPHGPHVLLIHSLVLYAFVFRLLARRGPGEPSASAYTPRLVHGAIIALVLVAFLLGVILSPRTNSLAGDLRAWLAYLDLLILFVVVLAVLRTISLWRAGATIALVLCAAVGIGFWEHFTHRGWSNFFYEHLPSSYQKAGAGPLQTRNGHVRSQGGAEFALEYGWVLAMLLPLLVVSVVQWSHSRLRWARLANLIPVLAVLAVLLSGARSATIAAVVAILLFLVLAGADRRLFAWGGLAILAGAIIAVADPSLVASVFSTSSDPTSVRLDRLGPLFALVVHRPFIGLGLTGLTPYFTLTGVDDGYGVMYATLGAIGMLTWLAVLVTSATTAAHALKARRGSLERMLGAACLVGIVAVAVAIATYDLPDTSQSTWALMVLAALGVAAAERAGHTTTLHWSPIRLVLPVGGCLLGFGALAVAPVSSSASMRVVTGAQWVLTSERAYFPIQGTELVDTLCSVVDHSDNIMAGTSVRCVQYQSVFPAEFPGAALVDVRGPTPRAVRQEEHLAFSTISKWMPMDIASVGTIATGDPSWARTAPLSGGALGVLAMLLLPPLSRRRSLREGEAETHLDEDAPAMNARQP